MSSVDLLIYMDWFFPSGWLRFFDHCTHFVCLANILSKGMVEDKVCVCVCVLEKDSLPSFRKWRWGHDYFEPVRSWVVFNLSKIPWEWKHQEPRTSLWFCNPVSRQPIHTCVCLCVCVCTCTCTQMHLLTSYEMSLPSIKEGNVINIWRTQS